MGANYDLRTLILTANRPNVATWEIEFNRLLTAKPDWT